jgi:dienelactone hydrolase
VGLYSREADAFLFQDISGIVKEMPEYVKKFARWLTDLDATINRVTGQGHKQKKRLMQNTYRQ